MQFILMVTAHLALLTLLPEPGRTQGVEKKSAQPPPFVSAGAQKSGDEPDLAITPNTIRIQSMDSPKEGSWVVMAGFSELGSPCLSRDGGWIAFDGYKAGFRNSAAESWIARRDGRDVTRLANGATPRWSPDGKRLLFARARANSPNGEEGIFVIDRDGTHERRIGEGRWPDWSPDGKQIVCSLGGEQTGGARIGATICIAKADGSGRREITQGDCPSWSPDGKKIAFCFRARERPPQIRVYALENKKEETLGIGWFRANWMSDSKSVVANGAIGRKRSMVRLSLDAPGEATELSTEFDEPISPCCSWDGKLIVFIAKRPKTGTR
jgi:dipeptidyl aminopeptidase/acylaminoacyl peptidase